MSDTCPTVKVKADNEQGFVVINESDFDPAVQKRFEVEEEATEETPKRRGRPAKEKEQS